jgi:hypothetical protein
MGPPLPPPLLEPEPPPADDPLPDEPPLDDPLPDELPLNDPLLDPLEEPLEDELRLPLDPLLDPLEEPLPEEPEEEMAPSGSSSTEGDVFKRRIAARRRRPRGSHAPSSNEERHERDSDAGGASRTTVPVRLQERVALIRRGSPWGGAIRAGRHRRGQ